MNDTTNTAPVDTDPTSPVSTEGNPNSLRVHFDPSNGAAQIEYLKTEGSSAVRNTADLALPTAEHFLNELAAHDEFLSDAAARLAQQRFDRAGRIVGFEMSDERERASLLRQVETRQAAKAYTTQRLAEAHATAEARAARRAQAVQDGQQDPEANSNVHEAARREALIAETANDIGSDGKPIGRVRATQLVDAELQRERVAARVRSRR